MKLMKIALVITILPVLAVLLCSSCIYTSNVVFPTDRKALYCFYDEENNTSYLYSIDIHKRQAELETKFDCPIFAIALSEDKKTLFYYELLETADTDGEEDKADDFLSLNMLAVADLSDTSNAKPICSFQIDSEGGIEYGSTFGAAKIVPLTEKGTAFVVYIVEENLIVLSKVDLEKGKAETIDQGVILYPKLSSNGKYLGYIKAEKEKSDEQGVDEEDKEEGFLCVVVVMEIDTMKKVEMKDIGRWEMPPQFAFSPVRGDEYKVLYPELDLTSNAHAPKGVSFEGHFLKSLEYIAGRNCLAIYSPEDESDKNLVEVTDLDGNIKETFDRGEFIPLAWSPNDRYFFLGKDNYLAQYIVARRIFALYEFVPPSEESEDPEIRSTLVRKVPDE